MPTPQNTRILAERPAQDFVGRNDEAAELYAFALARGRDPLIVTGAPGVGVSELLKQTYDRLFSDQTLVIPFYFALDADETPQEAAKRFLYQFLLQTVAFRRNDDSILDWCPDICELAELAVPADGHWIDRLVVTSTRDCRQDDAAFAHACLAAPLRADAGGARSFVVLDNCHAAAASDGAAAIYRMFREIFDGSELPYVLAGRRRFSFDAANSGRMTIGELPFSDASLLVESNASRYAVKINDETRDLLANQFHGNPAFLNFMFRAAAEKQDHFENFLNVQKIYTNEIFGGRIRRHYDSMISRIAGSESVEKGILSLLDVSLTLGTKQLSVESWLRRIAIGEPTFSQLLSRLNIAELIRLSGGHVEAMDGSDVLTDYIAARFRLDVGAENRAALFGESVIAYLKRAPQLMASFYRRNAAIGLRDLLASFSLQEVPLAALDYGAFADQYKGLDDDQIAAGLRADLAPIKLPQIVYTASAADLYKPIGELTEKERSSVALGFQEGRYIEADEIVWVAAEIDSKLEASRETAEFWCDRLEMVALMCDFHAYKIWLVASSGFTSEAMELIRQRNAFGSSRRQAGFLKQFVNGIQPEPREVIDEYEVTIPMDGDNEMIAARTLEEIARRHNYSARAINQIKTALLEASINASEHSLSPDRRIHQKFSVEDDRIVITISNRGIRLADRQEDAANSDTERRGWGLKLIEKLMDVVEIHQTDDGTSISMTKYLDHEVPA